ncbi:unnamed protein product [Discula destructiva]
MDKDKRDLYADLELSGFTNDVVQIKKQYKKLSLLKHPDRPGGSNEAFSIINHAHDVLTDPEKKRKYDADFSRRNRTAYASGVRGNPWASAGAQWAPPPRPPNFPQRAPPATQKKQPSTADKFAEMAGSARRTQTKPAAHSQWEAWDNIRSGTKKATGASSKSAHASRPTQAQPPPVPPRAAPQKQPKGSFGARVQKNGYIPESPGDEGAHSKDNYFTTRTHSNLFSETSNAARFRRRAPTNPPSPPPTAGDDSAFADMRQSTPYQTQGGERFDPWNGASNVGRSRSSRASDRKPYANDEENSDPSENIRQRSASIPNIVENLSQGAQNASGKRAASTTPASGGYQKSPKEGDNSLGKESHQLYAKQSPFTSTIPAQKDLHDVQQAPSRADDEVFHRKKRLDVPPELEKLVAQFKSSSEDITPSVAGLNGFEQNLKKVLQHLSVNKYGSQEAVIESARKAQSAARQSKSRANRDDHSNFGSQADTSTDSHRFTRNSTDNINTRFVAEEDANYQFSAGSPVTEEGRPSMPRSKSGSRVGRPPFSAQPSQNPFTQSTDSNSAQSGSFDPAEWSEKIDPSFFEAPTPQKTPVPTGRPARKSSKKPVRMTAGTAGLVDSEESSSGQEDIFKDPPTSGRTSAGGLSGTASPVPMDVDPPVSNAADNGVRNIPVTPSRPEWRAGDVGLGIKMEAKPVGGQQARFSPPVGGSEDTEEFKASFADLRNVEPFADRPSGLESFGDLKSNLPFQSAPAARAPVRKPVARKSHHLDLPVAPQPPASPAALGPNLGLKPSAATWKKYMDNFAQYMQEWHMYNTKFIDHFSARKVQMQAKLNNLDFIATKDDAGLAEYNEWLAQDHSVREKWNVDCNNHEINMRSFMVNRQKMMS